MGADPEMGRDIWIRGSQNALPGFTCWTRPQPLRRRGQSSEGLAPIRRKASHPSGQRQRVTDVAQLRRCPPLSRARALRPRRWYQPGLGSHAARQGGPPADSDVLACRRACRSTRRADVSGCPGASPDGSMHLLLHRYSQRQLSRELGPFTPTLREGAGSQLLRRHTRRPWGVSVLCLFTKVSADTRISSGS